MQDPKHSFIMQGTAESWTWPHERLRMCASAQCVFCGSGEEMFAACAAEHAEYSGTQQRPKHC